MNKDLDGNEYTFRTPSDWGTITGVVTLMPKSKFLYRDISKVLYHKIDPISCDLKLTTDVPK